MQDIVIKYRLDTSELDAAKRDLGLLGSAQTDLANDFKRVNQEAKNQAEQLHKIGTTGAKAIREAAKAADDLGDETDAATADAKKLNAELEKTGNAGAQNLNKAGAAGSSLKAIFTGIGSAVVAAFAVDRLIQFATKTIEITAEFQKFKAVLTNTLGSSGAADKALAMIAEFAAKTPFSVQQLTDSFIKLTNQGLQPNSEELRKLGDVAASTGKGFDQLTEALIDAAGGFEFERLKEFGIRAAKDGDQIKFTFKGVTTEVAATSQAVKDYVLGLGDLQGVSGSMAAISQTLGGQISNLGDSFDQLFLAIGTASNGVISDSIGMLGRLVTAITELIKEDENLTQVSYESAKAAQMQAAEAQTLLNRYDELTKGGVKPTGEAKKELDIITLQLRDSLGESVTAIDKETGALVLNKKAVREAIEQKLLLANQEALTLALRVNAINETLSKEQQSNKTLEQINKTRINILKEAGLSIAEANDLVLRAATGERFAKAMQADVKAAQEWFEASKQYNEGLGRGAGLIKERSDLLKKLAELGFDAAAVEKLFTDELKKQEDQSKKTGSATATETGLINELQKRIKTLTEARDSSESKTEIAAYNERIKKANEELQTLLNLNNAKAAKIDPPKISVGFELDEKGLQDLNALDAKKNEDRLHGEKLYQDAVYKATTANNERLIQAEKDKNEHIKELKNELFFVSVDLINQLFDAELNKLSERMEVLQADKENELTLAGNTAGAKEAIEKKYAEKEAAIRKEQAALTAKQAMFNKAIAISQIAINTALGITKVIAEVPKVDFGITTGILIAAYAALGALQAASVIAQPVPKFAKGTELVTGGKPGEDSVLAWLMPGERVVTTRENRDYNKTLSAIHNRKIPAAALNELVNTYLQTGSFIAPVYNLPAAGNKAPDNGLGREILKAISDQPKHITNFDENGVYRFIERSGRREQRLNERYSS